MLVGCSTGARGPRHVDTVAARPHRALQEARELRGVLADALQGVADAALNGAARPLRGRAAAPGLASQANAARELGADELQLLPQCRSAAQIGVVFGFGQLLPELADARHVFALGVFV